MSEITGKIVRKSGDKTVSVEVTRVVRHKIYGKNIVKSRRFLVHDPENKGQVGETVTIRESRPQSKKKRWALVTK